MSPSRYDVLVELVALYRESGAPVTTAAVAESLGVPEESLAESVESLRAFELVEATDGRYQPTVTGRELLELDVDPEGTLVLDFVEE